MSSVSWRFTEGSSIQRLNTEWELISNLTAVPCLRQPLPTAARFFLSALHSVVPNSQRKYLSLRTTASLCLFSSLYWLRDPALGAVSSLLPHQPGRGTATEVPRWPQRRRRGLPLLLSREFLLLSHMRSNMWSTKKPYWVCWGNFERFWKSMPDAAWSMTKRMETVRQN